MLPIDRNPSVGIELKGRITSAMMIAMKSTPQTRMSPGSRMFGSLALLLGIAALLGQPGVAQDQQPVSAVQQAPEIVTLDQAIQKAQANEALFAAARAQSKAASLDRSIARAALLPGATWHNQVLYTQPNGELTSIGPGAPAQATPRFIANNAIREYTSQAVVNELIGLKQFADVRAADAASAAAAAELEVARRGLIATVVALYYGAVASDSRLAVAKRAADEANDFTSLTQKREAAREAAHADVVKAQLQQQQRSAISPMRRSLRRRCILNWQPCCFPIRAHPTAFNRLRPPARSQRSPMWKLPLLETIRS